MQSGVVSLTTQTVTVKSKAFGHLERCCKILSKTQNLIENKNIWTITPQVGLYRFLSQNWKTIQLDFLTNFKWHHIDVVHTLSSKTKDITALFSWQVKDKKNISRGESFSFELGECMSPFQIDILAKANTLPTRKSD